MVGPVFPGCQQQRAFARYPYQGLIGRCSPLAYAAILPPTMAEAPTVSIAQGLRWLPGSPRFPGAATIFQGSGCCHAGIVARAYLRKKEAGRSAGPSRPAKPRGAAGEGTVYRDCRSYLTRVAGSVATFSASALLLRYPRSSAHEGTIHLPRCARSATSQRASCGRSSYAAWARTRGLLAARLSSGGPIQGHGSSPLPDRRP